MKKKQVTNVLDRLQSLYDIQSLSFSELDILAQDLRSYIIDTISKTGGHLGSSLGTVELTIALLYVFDAKKDYILWDVGHQAYGYKILTDRKEQFKHIRQLGGIAGFPDPNESPFDHCMGGHASNVISEGFGISVAKHLLNHNNSYVISVVGDGALSGGVALEGLNNVGETQLPYLIILNDNDKSIAAPTGAISSYLSRILSKRSSYKTIQGFNKFALSLTKRGNKMVRQLQSLARLTLGGGESFFDQLGYYYLGPVDGHNLKHLIPILRNIQKLHSGPILLHIITKKGKGYLPAEEAKDNLHGVSKFNVKTGPKTSHVGFSYSEIIGHYLVHKAKDDKKVIGITAAMPSGTGLDLLKEQFPKQYFDVGIAEQHAVDFAAGLAYAGIIPFVAIYSTFLQRAYDQIIHDVALAKLPVRFLLDRAGMVGEDGTTHQGIYDLLYLSGIPNIVLASPRNATQLLRLLETSYKYHDGPIFLRYEKEKTPTMPSFSSIIELPIGKGEFLQKGQNIAIIGLGHCIESLMNPTIQKQLQNLCGTPVTLFNTIFLKPFDEDTVLTILKTHDIVVSIEEGVFGGLSGKLLQLFNGSHIYKTRYLPITIPDYPIPHASRKQQLEMVGLLPNQIIQKISDFIKDTSSI